MSIARPHSRSRRAHRWARGTLPTCHVPYSLGESPDLFFDAACPRFLLAVAREFPPLHPDPLTLPPPPLHCRRQTPGQVLDCGGAPEQTRCCALVPGRGRRQQPPLTEKDRVRQVTNTLNAYSNRLLTRDRCSTQNRSTLATTYYAKCSARVEQGTLA